MRKRLTKAVVTAIVAALAAAFMVAFVWLDSDDEASASYRSLDYEATVQTNGDLKIVQHIDYHFKKREDDNGHTKYWRQLYWQYTLDSTNLTNITDIKVKNTTTGAEYSQINPQNPDRVDQYTWDSKFANHWYIADVTNGSSYPEPFDTQNDGLDPMRRTDTETVEVGWNIPYTVKADSMTFDVEMTFHGVATKYKDITTLPMGADQPHQRHTGREGDGRSCDSRTASTRRTRGVGLHTKNKLRDGTRQAGRTAIHRIRPEVRAVRRRGRRLRQCGGIRCRQNEIDRSPRRIEGR